MSFAEIIEQLKTLPPTTIAVAVGVLALLVFGLRLLLKKPPTHLVAFSGEAGSVLVSRKALQELIKQICAKNENVKNVSPVIKFKDGKVNTHAKLRLRSPENLKENCENIQKDITSLLQKSLSFDQIGEIEIVVASFAKDSKPSKEPEYDTQEAPSNTAPREENATPEDDSTPPPKD